MDSICQGVGLGLKSVSTRRTCEQTSGEAAVDISEQERHMIEIVRENAGTNEFYLSIERSEGAWEIDLSAGSRVARGVGSSFNDAWDNLAPLWV